jgi:translocator protein
MLNKKNKIILLFLSLLFCYGIEFCSSFFTRAGMGSWYSSLNRPSWTPPNLLFPIAWTILYTMIGSSLWLILCNSKAYSPKVFIAFFIQIFLNFTWSISFFYLNSPALGFINILLLLFSIAWNIHVFRPFSRLASNLLIPYLIWVIYATALNYSILVLNK